MNNINRPVFVKVFNNKHRAHTRIQCTNNKNNDPLSNPRNNKACRDFSQSIRDVLQVVTVSTSIISLALQTSAIYTCYFELSDEFLDVQSKLDLLVSRKS